MINSLILRGYGTAERIITRGYGPGRAIFERIRVEVLEFVTKMTRVVRDITTIDPRRF